MKYILAIETSCDETAASVVGFDSKSIKILSNIVSSQIKTHQKYGGVVPEIASRMHLEVINNVIGLALKDAKISLSDINNVAVTSDPGLVGSLLIGQAAAKTLSLALKIPVLEINHVLGHLAASFIDKNDSVLYPIPNTKYPILSLIVSGGHTQLMLTKDLKNYKIIGETLDDAAGEAFDKAAQILGLGYPGGPAISACADKINQNVIASDGEAISSGASRRSEANSNKLRDSSSMTQNDKIPLYSIHNTQYQLPVPMKDSGDLNFSFSGLKTALLYKTRRLRHPERSEGSPANTGSNKLRDSSSATQNDKLTAKDKSLFAYNFQSSLVESLVSKTIAAAKKYKPKTIALAGGVAANKYLREQLSLATQSLNPSIPLLVPDFQYCTDNAAMIGVAAAIKSMDK